MNFNGAAELDVTSIKSGGADDTARKLLEIWERSNGHLNEDLVSISPMLLLFNGAVTDEKPQMLLAGKQSLATRVLGAEWADAPKTAVSDLDDQYIKMIERGYHKAIHQSKPVFEYIATDLSCADGPLVHLKYQRLVLPFQTMYGQQYLFCYSHDAGISRPIKDLRQGDKPLHLTDLPGEGYANRGSLAGCSK